MTETILAAVSQEAVRPGAAELLQALGESLGEMIVYFDIGTKQCCYANSAFAKRFGLTSQSALGKTPEQILGLAYWTSIAPHVERTLHGEHVKYLQEHAQQDGTVRMHRVSLVPHFNAQGKQTGVVGRTTDYTHRWEAERAVRESDERTRKFAEVTEEAIAFHSKGVILDCNDAMTRLSGYPIDEVVGRNIFGFLTPASRSAAIEHAQRGDEQLYEASLVHRDGQQIPVEILPKNMPKHTGNYRVVVLRALGGRWTVGG